MKGFWNYRLGHVLFWIVTVGFHVYTRLYLIEQAGWLQFLLEIVVRNALLAIIIYAHFEFLIPAWAQQKKFLAYGTGLLLCFGLYVIVKNTHDVYLNRFLPGPSKTFWDYSFYNFSIALFYVTFSLALELSRQWYLQRERLRQMELEKLNTELEYLKMQINPHFLFNSLNTIFFQIDKNNMHARDTLTKFSEMLRFQLYECDGQEIALEKEINYLRNYVDLQRLRKDEKYAIEFSMKGDGNNFKVAPLLLMPLAENAFKHVSHYPEGNNSISIQISCDENELQMAVRNTKEARKEPGRAGGIGLRNLQRRLELQYPNRYAFDFNETQKEFEVVLKIKR